MKALIPLITFLTVFLSSGIYFHIIGVDNAFYQISPTVAALLAIIVSFIIPGSKLNLKLDWFLDGVRDKNIIIMCMIFLLAGAFSVVTRKVGCVECVVNYCLTILKGSWFLPGLFLLTAAISTAMGSSMGVIAAIAPIAIGVVEVTTMPAEIALATVVGGAMFGDNLSLISDTTIASVSSTEADPIAKFKLNAIVAVISGLITIAIIYYFAPDIEINKLNDQHGLIYITPYILIIILAFLGFHIFAVLIIGIVYTFIIAVIGGDYTLLALAKDTYQGFTDASEIMMLSMLIGGMSEIFKKQGGVDFIFNLINKSMTKVSSRGMGKFYIELVMAKLVSIYDIFVVNNTIAVIMAGPIAKRLALEYNIARERCAFIIDTFSCVFQGLLPYSAQVLLAASIGKVSTIAIIPWIFYCFVLAIVSILFLFITRFVEYKK